jgi:hypothetical protein
MLNAQAEHHSLNQEVKGLKQDLLDEKERSMQLEEIARAREAEARASSQARPPTRTNQRLTHVRSAPPRCTELAPRVAGCGGPARHA